MATMNVSSPDPMKAWVETQARNGRYSNASDYVRDLIRRDQRRADQRAALQHCIDEAEASGNPRFSARKDGPQCMHRRDQNGHCNQHFHRSAWDVDESHGGECECKRVANRECRDDANNM